MPIKCDGTYTEFEVSKLLKLSEGRSLEEEIKRFGTKVCHGHAEGKHEIKQVGEGRAHITPTALDGRVLDNKEKLTIATAFNGCQIEAVTCALNKKAGQNALSLLCYEHCNDIFAFINISEMNYKMLEFNGHDYVK